MILNLLPLTAQEKDAFLQAAPQEEQVFLPMEGLRYHREQVDPALLSRATAILGNVPPKDLPLCGALQWLQTWSAGTDPYTAPGVFPSGTALTSAVGAFGPSVSEHIFACLLALMKRLPAYRDNQQARVWRDEGQAKTLQDATVLLLGTGDLGRHLAAKCKALGAQTVGLNRHPEKPVEGFDEVRSISELDFWLPGADVVALNLPGTPEAHHILDERRLRLMKPDAILLNSGRGGAVDCLALAKVLQEGHLWGAALDVTEPEPLPADHPLWGCPTLLLTPHAAGGAHLDSTVRRTVAIALDNLQRYLSRQPLKNQVL